MKQIKYWLFILLFNPTYAMTGSQPLPKALKDLYMSHCTLIVPKELRGRLRERELRKCIMQVKYVESRIRR